MNSKIRAALVQAGIRNLREFGYPSVNASNITSDTVFAGFFDRMLEEHPGHKEEVADLRAEIARHKAALAEPTAKQEEKP